MTMLVDELETPSKLQKSQSEYPGLPEHLKPYLFQKGHAPLPGGGRPLGSKAINLFQKAESRIARAYLNRSLSPHSRDQGEMLRHAINKFIPDAGKDASPSSAGVHVVVFVGDGATPRTVELAQNLSNVTPQT